MLTQQEYNDWVAQRMIDKLYRGSATNLVASLVDGGMLSAGDIADIQAYFEAVSKK